MRNRVAPAIGLSIVTVALAAPAAAQSATQKLAFEVATIKPTDPNVPHMMGVRVYPGGRATIPAVSLKSLVETAFGISYWQVTAGEPWMEKELYDVEGKPPSDLQPPVTDLRYTWTQVQEPRLREMLQSLLSDRFGLKFHRETRNGTVFVLERGAGKLTLRPTASDEEHVKRMGDAGLSGNLGFAGGQWNIFNSTMAQVAMFAQNYLFHAPVLDRTNLTGAYDFRQPAASTDPHATGDDVSFVEFLSDAGLRIKRDKGPIEMLVIDSAERPSPN